MAEFRDIGDQFMFGLHSSSTLCCSQTLLTEPCIWPDAPAVVRLLDGSFDKREAARSMLTRLSIAFPLTCVPARFFRSVPKSEYADEKPAGPIELRIYTVPTENSSSIKTPATVTTMSTVCTLSSNALVGSQKPNFDDWSREGEYPECRQVWR